MVPTTSRLLAHSGLAGSKTPPLERGIVNGSSPPSSHQSARLSPCLASLLASRFLFQSEPCYSGRHQDFAPAVTFRANPATYAALTLTHDTCSVGVQHTSHLLTSTMYAHYRTWKGTPMDRREVDWLRDKPTPAAEAREYRQHQLRTPPESPYT